MDQGRLRLLLGSLFYILLAIGLIIFAVITVKIASSIENVEQLETVPSDKHKTDNITVIQDLSEHDDSKHTVTTETVTTTTITTTSTVTSTAPGM